MFATLMALGGAVVTVLLYAVAAERMDYATVQRRQLDLWVAAIGFGCLVTILYGAAEVRRTNGAVPTPAPMAATRPPLVTRHFAPDLHRGTVPSDPAAAGDEAVAAQAVATDNGAPISSAATEPAAPYYHGIGWRRPTAVSLPGPQPVAPASLPVASAVSMPSWRGVFTPVLEVLPLATPMPPGHEIPIATLAATALPRDPTDVPPPQRPLPTEPPDVGPPLPTATPYCGDPQDIRVTLDVVDAFVDRGGDTLAVGYRAEVRNASAFPVTLVDIAAVVESRDVGSERFGHQSVSDVALEPGVLHRLDGRVELTKSPPPFDLTRLCVSFVPQTCGRALPYRITKHCFDTRGF
jgi:hypothetical protein